MAARKHREIHGVEQMKKVAPFITRGTTFGYPATKLALGVDIFDYDLGVQVYSVKQPV